jgi:hypothetical protein
LHFYTLNGARATKEIFSMLDLDFAAERPSERRRPEAKYFIG